jgi:hypothetical protein
VAFALHQGVGMDTSEFDRLIARIQDPRLIPGIYNYCDGRCARCAFTDRCLVFLEEQDACAATRPDDRAAADGVQESIERTIVLLAEIARREGIDLSTVATDGADESAVTLEYERDPLVVHAREYGTLAGRVGRAIAPAVAARGDQSTVDALGTIEWFSSRIAAKVYRAVCGRADGWQDDPDVQTDYDGSAKAALLGIAASRAAWLTLMEAGKATADGVPARAAQTLDDLAAAIRRRFPDAEQFVRPGFDEPAIAAGAPATHPPWARRRSSGDA